MKVIESRAIDDVAAGSILGAAVVDDGGHVLMPAGGELTEAILNSLRRREIERLTIEIELDEAAYEARRARCEEKLRKLFRHAGDDPQTRELFQTMLQHRIREGGV